jgi:hypothetical protein
MTGQDDREPTRRDLPPRPGGPADGDDILEHGRERPRWVSAIRWPAALPRPAAVRWPPRPAAVLLLVAGLLAGLAAGYTAGDRHAGRSAAPLARGAPSEEARLAAGGLALSQPGPACSAQVGHDLQVGLEVTNVSGTGLTLRRAAAVLPLGGLKEVGQAWGTCGELPQADAGSAASLPAGASIWFTVTLKVLVRCPGPLPVQFSLDYIQRGKPASVHLPGFDDLGQVPYSGCP